MLVRYTCTAAFLLTLLTTQAQAWQAPAPLPQIQYLEGLSQRPYSVAISPDGRTVLAGTIDGTIGVWDRQTGHIVRIFQAQAGPLLSLSVSPTGRFYAATGISGPVQVFDLPRRNALAELTGLSGDPTCVAISSDGRFAVSGDSAKIVRVFDLVTKKAVRDLPGHTAAITDLTFLSNSQSVLAIAADGTLRGWLTSDGQANGVFQTAPVNSLAVDTNGTRLALAGNDGVVRIAAWPPRPRQQLVQHTANVAAVAITPDGHTIVTASENQQLQLFDGQTGKALRTLAGQQGVTTSLGIHRLGQLVLTGNNSGAWQAWDAATGTMKPGRGGHTQNILAIAVSPVDPSTLATAGTDGSVRTWTLAPPHSSLGGHTMSLTSIALAADGKTLVTGSSDKTLRTWNTDTSKPGRTLKAATDAVASVATNRDGTLLVRGNAVGRLEINSGNDTTWNLGAHAGRIQAVAVLPDGKTVISAGADGRVRTWNPKPQPTASFPTHPGPVRVVARSGDGKLLATGSNDGKLRLLTANTGKMIRTLDGLAGTITAAAFARNTTQLVAGNNSGQVRIWNLADGSVVGQAAVHTGAVTGVALHPDGKRLVTAGTDGAWKLWALPLKTPANKNGKKSDKKDKTTAKPAEPIQPTAMVTAHAGGVTSLDLSADGKQVLTGGIDKQAKLFAITGTLVRTFAGHASPIRAVQLTAERVIAAGDDKTVRSWMRSNGAAGPIVTLPAAVLGLAVDTSGLRVAASLADGSVRVVDVVAGAQLEWFVGHKGAVRGVVWTAVDALVTAGDDKSIRPVVVSATSVHIADATSVGDLALLPDGSGYFTGGADRTLKRWGKDGKLQKTLATLAAPIRHVSISPDGKTVAAGGDPLAASKNVQLFAVADGKQLSTVQMPAGVTAIAMSDNSRLAVADSAKALHWFQATTGRLLETTSTSGVATDLVASPDGRTLYLASADNNAWVVHASLDHLLIGHKGAATGVAFSNDGRFVFSTGIDNGLRQWDTTTGTATRTYSGSNKPLLKLAVSADGTRLAAATNDNRVLGWPLRADAAKTAVASDLAITTPAAIADLAINDDGTVIATALTDNAVSLWHTGASPGTSTLLERIAGHTSTLRSIALSANARQLVSGANDRFVFQFHPAVQTAFTAHSTPIRSAVFTPDGKQLITAGDDKRVARWMVPDGQPVNEYAGSGGIVRAVAVSGNGQVVAAGGDDGMLRTWSLTQGQPLAQAKLPAAITDIALDSAGSTVAVTSDLVVRQFELATRDGKPTLVTHQDSHGHTKTATAIALATADRGMVTVGLDRTLRHWYAAQGPATTVLTGHSGPVYASAFSPDETWLATAGADRTVRVWSLETGRGGAVMKAHSHQVTGVAFNPNPKVQQLISISLDGTMLAWPQQDDSKPKDFNTAVKDGLLEGNFQPPQTLHEGSEGGLLDVAVSPNGNVISLVGRDRRFKLLDRSTLKLVRDLPAHAHTICAVAFNGSGTRAVTLDRSGKLFLWNTANGSIHFHQQLPTKRATAMAYAPDGTEVFVAGADKRLLKIIIPAAAR